MQPSKDLEDLVSLLAETNVNIKRGFLEFSILEMDYSHPPLIWSKGRNSDSNLKKFIKYFLDYENEKSAVVYLNEAAIDELIFNVYELSNEDKQLILEREGIPVGSLPLISGYNQKDVQLPLYVNDYIQRLNVMHLSDTDLQGVKKNIENLYSINNSIEEISKNLNINPISIIQILKESSKVPLKRMNDIAKEFLFDVVREILREDEDGIIPLVEYTGEIPLQKRLFDKLVEKGFSPTQVDNYREILGEDISTYLDNHFFADLCNTLNLFMYLPKTPFIWHLSAGEYRSFEVYILIYKWNRDKMYRLRSVYVERRESSLKNRLIDLEKDDSIQAQKEKEHIRNQLIEINSFKQKIDEILKSGYDPKLDDGVGKNIAPLQEKGLLKVEVLKKKELKLYLEADW